jgi:afadin
MFHIRRKPADFYPRKRKKKPMMKEFASESALMAEERSLPFLLEMNPDGSDIGPSQGRMPQRFRLSPNMTEVGSDPAIQSGQCLLLPPAPFVQPRHCVIAHTEGIVTVTPSHREAETFVNNSRIFQTTILQPGCIVRFGRNQCFRFVDPLYEERLRHQASSVTLPDPYANYVHYGPPGAMGGPPNRIGAQTPMMQQQLGRDHILPAVLEFREETEETFFNEIINGLDVNNVQFKLAPTYTLYMATRFRASTHYRTELIPEERAIRLTDMLNYVADMVYSVIEANQRDAGYLAFWMANASEILHFLKSDRHITSFSHQAQDLLAEAVHLAFKHLVVCLQADLEMSLPALLYDGDDDIHSNDQTSTTTHGILQVLQSAMGLLRKCRVNAALTIQLFSQLFHFINMWTFNQIVGYDQMPNHHLRPGTVKNIICCVQFKMVKQTL